MGTKNNPGNFDCHAKAEDDEPLFTLLARDKFAPNLVRLWAALREQNWEQIGNQFLQLHAIAVHNDYDPSDDAKITEACECAGVMEAWKAKRNAV